MVRLMQTQSFHALEYEGRTYDCGDKLGYLRAVAGYALANEEHGARAAETLRAALADKA
jgi:UTP--glucose-1-phosphate uridylyltransferase